MGVDFVKPDDKAAADGKPGGYDIEYTNPAVDDAPAPTRKMPLLNWLTQFKSSQPVKKPAVAQPVTLPPTQATRATTPVLATQPTAPSKPPADKAYAITEHQETSVALNAETPLLPINASGKPVAKSARPVVKAPAVLHRSARVLPPPPPPPQKLRQPAMAVVGQTTPAVQPVSFIPAPTQTTQSAFSPVAPVTSSPQVTKNLPIRPIVSEATTAPTGVPTMPAAPAAPAAPPTVIAKGPSAPHSGRTPSAPASAVVSPDGNIVGPVVVARNVSGMHGNTTDPAVITSTSLNVNLLPEYAAVAMRGLAAPLRLLRFAIGCVCCFTLVYAIMVGYEAYFIYRTEIGQQHLQELNTRILKYSDLQQKIAVTNDTLSTLNELLQSHTYWSNWFNFLEAYTLPDVYFTDLTANQVGVVNLEGVAKDYTTVTHQVNAFRAATTVVQSVEVNTAARSLVESDVTVTADMTDEASESTNVAESPVPTQTTLVHFTLSLHINPKVLLYSSDYYTYEPAP